MLLAAGVLVAGLSVAAADTAVDEEAAKEPAREMLETCLNAAQTVVTMQACKRIVFKPCYELEEYRQSTHGLVMCNSREGTAWEALLASRTAEIAKRDAYRAEALSGAEKAWRAWIEAECFFHRAEAQGGSAEGVITTECLSDLTANRVIDLTWQLRGNLPY
jgi:uncharacterized protein YecT (DUF1311 family)